MICLKRIDSNEVVDSKDYDNIDSAGGSIQLENGWLVGHGSHPNMNFHPTMVCVWQYWNLNLRN